MKRKIHLDPPHFVTIDTTIQSGEGYSLTLLRPAVLRAARAHSFAVCVVSPRSKLPQDGADSPFQEAFKRRIDAASTRWVPGCLSISASTIHKYRSPISHPQFIQSETFSSFLCSSAFYRADADDSEPNLLLSNYFPRKKPKSAQLKGNNCPSELQCRSQNANSDFKDISQSDLSPFPIIRIDIYQRIVLMTSLLSKITEFYCLPVRKAEKES